MIALVRRMVNGNKQRMECGCCICTLSKYCVATKRNDARNDMTHDATAFRSIRIMLHSCIVRSHLSRHTHIPQAEETNIAAVDAPVSFVRFTNFEQTSTDFTQLQLNGIEGSRIVNTHTLLLSQSTKALIVRIFVPPFVLDLPQSEELRDQFVFGSIIAYNWFHSAASRWCASRSIQHTFPSLIFLRHFNSASILTDARPTLWILFFFSKHRNSMALSSRFSRIIVFDHH